MNKFNYILNDLALSNLITRCLYSENADCSDKEELENQIKLIQQENQQLKDNWNTLKQKMIDSFNESQDVQFLDVLQYMQELEQGSDSNVED